MFSSDLNLMWPCQPCEVQGVGWVTRRSCWIHTHPHATLRSWEAIASSSKKEANSRCLYRVQAEPQNGSSPPSSYMADSVKWSFAYARQALNCRRRRRRVAAAPLVGMPFNIQGPIFAYSKNDPMKVGCIRVKVGPKIDSTSDAPAVSLIKSQRSSKSVQLPSRSFEADCPGTSSCVLLANAALYRCIVVESP